MPFRNGNVAFTLVEILVAVVVMVLLMVLVLELFNAAIGTATLSRKHIDADEAARLVFDRMGGDLARMAKRSDVNYIFYKQGTSSTTGSNDAMFFYSEGPGYLDPAASLSTSGSASSMALVGYRINSNSTYYQGIPVMERLGENLTWAGAPDTASAPVNPGGMAFLPATLAGNWSNVLGTPPYTTYDTEHYQVLSDMVFRMEFSFLVKSGTYSLSGTNSFTGASTGYLNTPTAIPPSTSPTTGIPTTANYFTGSSGSDLAGSVYGLPPDLAAIVVTVAIMDSNSREVVSGATLSKLAAALPDSLSGNITQGESGIQVNPQSTGHLWQNQLIKSGFANSIPIPQTALAQVRIYERTFYVNAN